METPLEPPEVIAPDAVTARVSGYNIAGRVVTAVSMTGGRHVFAILAGVVVARGLGPVGFGNFMFLLAGFTTLHTLLDLSSSQGFFTFICKQAWPPRLYAAYGFWIALQFLLPLLVIGLFFPAGWVASIWRGQARDIVLMAFVASFAQRVFWQLVTQVYEARRLTVRVQLATAGIMAAHFVIALLLRRFGGLSAQTLFIAIAAEFTIVGVVLLLLMAREFHGAPAPSVSRRQVANEMLLYVAPLIPPLLLISLNSFGETWLLQIFGGPKEQAYFSVAQQYANIGLVFGFSSTSVFWKELAAAQERGAMEDMRRIYINSTRVLLFSAALMAGFGIFWADILMQIILGPAYVPAGAVFAVTLFTSISQCFGIVVSIIYLATSRTRAWSWFQIGYVLISVPGSLLVLWVMKLGALGLALKLAVMSTASILAYDWYISRQFGWKLDNAFRLVICVLLLAAGFASRAIADFFVPGWTPVIRLVFAGIIYGLIAGPLLLLGAQRLGYLTRLRGFWAKVA